MKYEKYQFITKEDVSTIMNLCTTDELNIPWKYAQIVEIAYLSRHPEEEVVLNGDKSAMQYCRLVHSMGLTPIAEIYGDKDKTWIIKIKKPEAECK